MLVLVLAVALPLQSARAGMTEIVVGGTVLIQALQVVAELVPQLTALGASMNALGEASKELVQTGQRLVHMLFPGLKTGITRKATKIKLEKVDVPTFTGPSQDAPASEPAGPAADGAADEDIQLSVLVNAYRERTQPAAQSHGSHAGPAASLVRGESFESLSDSTSQKLLETIRAGDHERLARFVAAVNELPAEDRGAVKPAVRRVVKQGAAFSRLHGEDGPAVTDGFKKLQRLAEGLD